MENNIRKLRLARHMTQVELAKYLGVAQNTLSYWENGRFDIDLESLQRLAEFFVVSTDCILGLETPKDASLLPENEGIKKEPPRR